MSRGHYPFVTYNRAPANHRISVYLQNSHGYISCVLEYLKNTIGLRRNDSCVLAKRLKYPTEKEIPKCYLQFRGGI